MDAVYIGPHFAQVLLSTWVFPQTPILYHSIVLQTLYGKYYQYPHLTHEGIMFSQW